MTRERSKTVVRYCEARTRAGTPCKREAGWGTEHVGRGRCKLHGGKSPSHGKRAAREEAHEFLSGQLGYESNVDPLDAAVIAVRMADGARIYWLEQLANAYAAGQTPSLGLIEGYRTAMLDLSRMTDVATKAGVAERLVAIGERQVEQISLAFEEALAGEKIEREQRMRIVARFGEGLSKIENDQLALPRGD